MKNETILEVPTLSLQEAINVVKKMYNYGVNTSEFVNIFLYGKPGIGKTEGIKNLCEELGIGYINIRLSHIPPADFKGNPINVKVGEGERLRQSYSIPSLLPCEEIHGEKGILLLDEANTCPQLIESMSQQLLDSRKIGDHKIPDGWMILTANNLRSHGANVRPISKPVANRAIHFNVKENLDEWIDNYAIPHDIDPLIIAYLKQNPSRFYVLPANNESAFPTPRSWSKASHMAKAGLHNYIAAAIGQATFTDFELYFKYKELLPDWNQIDNSKYVWKGQDNISVIYTSVYSAISISNADNFKSLVDFFFNNVSPEYLQLFIKGSIAKYMKPTKENREQMRSMIETKLPNGMNMLEYKTKVVMREEFEINQIMEG